MTRNGFMIGVSLVVGAGAAVYTYANREALFEPKSRDLVTYTAEWHDPLLEPDDACAKKKAPLRLRVTNGSTETLKSATFRLEVYDRGDSEGLVQSPLYDWTIILSPGEAASACFRPEMRRWPRDPVPMATLGSAYFYGKDEPIPK